MSLHSQGFFSPDLQNTADSASENVSLAKESLPPQSPHRDSFLEGQFSPPQELPETISERSQFTVAAGLDWGPILSSTTEFRWELSGVLQNQKACPTLPKGLLVGDENHASSEIRETIAECVVPEIASQFPLQKLYAFVELPRSEEYLLAVEVFNRTGSLEPLRILQRNSKWTNENPQLSGAREALYLSLRRHGFTVVPIDSSDLTDDLSITLETYKRAGELASGGEDPIISLGRASNELAAQRILEGNGALMENFKEACDPEGISLVLVGDAHAKAEADHPGLAAELGLPYVRLADTRETLFSTLERDLDGAVLTFRAQESRRALGVQREIDELRNRLAKDPCAVSEIFSEINATLLNYQSRSTTHSPIQNAALSKLQEYFVVAAYHYNEGEVDDTKRALQHAHEVVNDNRVEIQAHASIQFYGQVAALVLDSLERQAP
ncbi:MAG: hypothetical protein KDD64_16660 [Bdellovibrionales bacterium]|nr:hypothetical protein [Bdellovibrionales bacterium]